MKKKVLHIITRFIKGGADENTMLTLHGLDRNKYSVDFIVGGESDKEFLQQVDSAIRVIMVPELVRDLHPVHDLLAFVKICRQISKGKYDIVHTHTAKAGILGRLAAAYCGVPAIIHGLHGVTFHEHTHPMLRHIYILLERLAGYMTDLFVTVGEEIKETYTQHRIGRPTKYVTIRSGFDLLTFRRASQESPERILSTRRQLGLDDNDIVLGMVSRLEPRKGHSYLLQAAKRVIEQVPNVRFLIVGDGHLRQPLEQQAQQMGLNGGVRFLGFRNDVPSLMTCMDVFLFTSLWEGLPRVLAQAVATGKPVVSFEVDGVNEIVKNGVNGYIVPSEDVDAFTMRLLDCTRDLCKTKAMGLKGRKYVDDSWRSDVMVRQMNELYDNLFRLKDNSTRF